MSTADDRDRRILARRAELLARPLAGDGDGSAEIEVAVCEAGSELFGFPVEHLREIVPRPAVTPLPFAPPWFVGVAQVRGSLLCVVDLAAVLHAPVDARSTASAGHVVVVEHHEGPIGFAVGGVRACRRVPTTSLSTAAGAERTVLGVTADLLVVLDVPRLVALPELVLR